jgi:hypothetical protein
MTSDLEERFDAGFIWQQRSKTECGNQFNPELIPSYSGGSSGAHNDKNLSITVPQQHSKFPIFFF